MCDLCVGGVKHSQCGAVPVKMLKDARSSRGAANARAQWDVQDHVGKGRRYRTVAQIHLGSRQSSSFCPWSRRFASAQMLCAVMTSAADMPVTRMKIRSVS